jgi:hypothetical protein
MSLTRNSVVVHFDDGRILKGYTHDFVPEKDSFHLNTAIEPGAGTIHDVKVVELKAVFFVKTPGGNPQYSERSSFDDAGGKALHGIKIKVVFKDGETIRGISMGYNKAKKGFFIIPIDPQSNNERIYVVASAATSVIVGAEAER